MTAVYIILAIAAALFLLWVYTSRSVTSCG